MLLLAALPLLRGWPAASALAEARWWVWVGGSLGAVSVLGSIVAAPASVP